MKDKGLSPNAVSLRSALSSITNGLGTKGRGDSHVLKQGTCVCSTVAIHPPEGAHTRWEEKKSGRTLGGTPIADPKFYVCTGALYSIDLIFFFGLTLFMRITVPNT